MLRLEEFCVGLRVKNEAVKETANVLDRRLLVNVLYEALPSSVSVTAEVDVAVHVLHLVLHDLVFNFDHGAHLLKVVRCQLELRKFAIDVVVPLRTQVPNLNIINCSFFTARLCISDYKVQILFLSIDLIEHFSELLGQGWIIVESLQQCLEWCETLVEVRVIITEDAHDVQLLQLMHQTQ